MRSTERSYRKTLVSPICSVVLATAVGVAGSVAHAQNKDAPKPEEAVTLDIAGGYANSQPVVGPAQGQLVELINSMTGGSLKAKLHEPGALVPTQQYLSAVGTGTLDAAWTTASEWASKDSAFWLFSSVPFGRGPDAHLAWLKYGGGETLFKQLHMKYNVEALPCGMSPAASSGWFRNELSKPADFKGLKVRTTGIASQVLRNMGAEPQVVSNDELRRALETNVIDAVMFNTPALNETLGVEEFAKNIYFPAWQQPSTLNELLISKKKWAALSRQHRAVIQGACDIITLRQLTEAEAQQGKALNDLIARGFKPFRWSDEILAAFHKSWEKTATDLSVSSEEFKKAWESYKTFAATQKAWMDYSSSR